MGIYAISDLHLSFGVNKPMNIFGDNWENHAQRLRDNWVKIIREDDVVLIPGDISWGINLEEADPDFAYIEALPGKKILAKGNHDYWWSTLRKFDQYLEEKGYRTIKILRNNAYRTGDYTVCGSRGWISPDEEGFDEKDKKVFNRECQRLGLSLQEGRKLGGELIAMLHYPPFDNMHHPNAFADILKAFGVKTCIYGHIHGNANDSWKNETIDGINYHLVSCNMIGFSPVKLRP